MKQRFALLAAMAVMLLGGCALAAEEGETDMSVTHESEVREGVSEPSYYDEALGADYDTGTGWSFEMMNKKPPLPAGNDTVLNTPADPSRVQVLFS